MNKSVLHILLLTTLAIGCKKSDEFINTALPSKILLLDDVGLHASDLDGMNRATIAPRYSTNNKLLYFFDYLVSDGLVLLLEQDTTPNPICRFYFCDINGQNKRLIKEFGKDTVVSMGNCKLLNNKTIIYECVANGIYQVQQLNYSLPNNNITLWSPFTQGRSLPIKIAGMSKDGKSIIASSGSLFSSISKVTYFNELSSGLFSQGKIFEVLKGSFSGAYLSPDGKKIGYVSLDNTNKFSVYIKNTNQDTSTLATNTYTFDILLFSISSSLNFQLSWLNDNKGLVVSYGNITNQDNVVSVNVINTEDKKLINSWKHYSNSPCIIIAN